MSNSFIFYESFLDAIDLLPTEQQAEAYRAIALYALKGEEAKMKSNGAKMIFTLAKPLLDANTTRRENGSKGGRPNKANEKTNGFENEKPTVSKPKNQRFSEEKTNGYENGKPNVNVNVDVNVDDNVNVDVNDNANANADENTAATSKAAGVESCAGDIAVIKFIEQELAIMLSPIAVEQINDWLNQWSDREIIRLAVTEAVKQNKRTIAYVSAVLGNWRKQGLQTAAEVKKAIADFEARKKSKSVGDGRKQPSADNFKGQERDLSFLVQ